MPRDFKSYAKEHQSANSSNQEKAKGYEEIINKYKNMNQQDLMASLFSEASKLKQQGKLDENSLNSLKGMLSPYLDSNQKEMLNSLINALNEQT